MPGHFSPWLTQVGRLFDALMARTDLQSHEREDLARGLLWFAKQK